MRWTARLLLFVGLSCQGADETPRAAMPAVAPSVEVPTTKEEFLRRLLPVPGGQVVVVYDVSGPAGLTGTLELLVAEGGRRRENWRLTLAIAGGPPDNLQGTTIQTPDWMWTAVGDGHGTLTPVAVGPLADAYAAASPRVRRAVAAVIATWRADLDRARREHPGETREIAGQTCLWQRVAAQTVCVWEGTGIPLRYEGPAFTVEAVRIDREPGLATNAFELPPQAGHRPDGQPTSDAADGLKQLAAGDTTSLAQLLQPGFRPPNPPG